MPWRAQGCPRLTLSADSATLADMDASSISPTKAPDEWGLVATGLVTVAGVFALPDRLGLDANQWVTLLGALGMLATAGRAIGRRWLAARGH